VKDVNVSKRPLRYDLRSADQIFFIHIPKTGGTTFYSILAKQYPEEQVWPSQREDLDEYLTEHGSNAISGYRVLRAHYDYSIYRRFPRKPVYVTMLRDPVARVVSLYEHIKRVPAHRLHREVVMKNLTLMEFSYYEPVQNIISNRQVNQLVGAIQGDAKELSDRAKLEIARVRLDEFGFFGLTEHFEDSIRLLCHTFGWKPITDYDILNVAPQTSRPSDLDDDVVNLLERINQLDLELYRYAEKLFRTRLRQMEIELMGEAENSFHANREIRKGCGEKHTDNSKGVVHTNLEDLNRLSPKIALQYARTLVTLGRIRRWIIPEGSKLEERYLLLRNKLFGW
jgi:hypothetical protein